MSIAKEIEALEQKWCEEAAESLRNAKDCRQFGDRTGEAAYHAEGGAALCHAAELAALRQRVEGAQCDMGELCIGCEPRNADGSCPAAPAAVYAVATGGVSESGNELYSITDEPIPNADNWKLHTETAPAAPAESGWADEIGRNGQPTGYWIRTTAPAAVVDEVTQATIDSILHKLEEWSKAYPLDVFPEPTEKQRDWLHEGSPGLMDRVSASMGRHMAKMLTRDIAYLRAALSGKQGKTSGDDTRLEEIACDLPYLLGRASLEGHEAGQRLAREVQAKMRTALTAKLSGNPATTAAVVDDEMIERVWDALYNSPGRESTVGNISGDDIRALIAALSGKQGGGK